MFSSLSGRKREDEWGDAEGAILPSERERAEQEAERAAELQAQLDAYAARFGPLPDD